jgi:hypothetical protein
MASPVESTARTKRKEVRPHEAAAPPPRRPPPAPPPPPSRPRPRPRRVLLGAFGASALIHLLAVLFYPLFVRREGVPPPGPVSPTVAPRLQGIEVVRMREVMEVADPEPSPVQPAPAAVPPAAQPRVDPAPQPPGVEAPAAPAPAGPAPDPRTAAERLRPRVTNPRFWTLSPEATALTLEQILGLDLIWAIVELNDSTAIAAAAARSLTDWTYTDAGGKRWGVADGKLFLGDFSIPVPFAFGDPLSPGSAAAQRAWMDAEINRAAGSAAARANMTERIRAIRERAERERRRLQPDSSAVPPPGG